MTRRHLVGGLKIPASAITATPLSIEFIKETSVLTGGYLPEFPRLRRASSLVPKAAQRVHGSVFGNYTPCRNSRDFPGARPISTPRV